MRLIAIVAIIIGSVMPALSQDDRTRAQNAVDSLAPISSELTRGNMEAVVGSFVTDNPDETSLRPEDFDEEEIERQYANDDTANAFSAAKDSTLTRPEVEMVDDPLALADDAIEQSDSVVGGLFSSSGGVCSQEFQGGRFQGTQFCRKLLSRTIESCTQVRNVSVDREDRWRCSTETTDYVKTCNRGVSWSCNGYTGNSCRSRAILWSGYSGSWSGNLATVSLPAVGGCSIKTHTFHVRRRDYLNGGVLELYDIQANGVLQIRINNSIVYTHGGVNSNLSIRDRGCGKNCSVKAVYAGNTHIEDCGSARRTWTPRLDLYRYTSVARPGPSSESGSSISISQGKLSGWVRIDIIRGNSGESAPRARVYSTGSCCTSFRATVGGAC
jgi:hypothetical protein